MKTVTNPGDSTTIKGLESPQRPHENPELSLALLDQTSKITNRLAGDAEIGRPAQPVSATGLETILAGGLTHPRRTWKSYATSGLVHASIAVLLLSITIPAIQETRHRARVVLIAPQLQRYTPKRIKTPRIELPKPMTAKVLIQPAVVKVPEVKPKPLQPAPAVKVTAPVVSAEPLPKIEAPELTPAPKPQLRTGVFETADLAKSAQQVKQIKTGGFGDPHGVPANAPTSSSVNMAKIGSFDLPNGEEKGGGGGGGARGSAGRGVVQGSFGSAEGQGTGGNGRPGSVHPGGFGDATAQVSGSVQRAAPAAPPSATPVEILFKPKPVYSVEARNLKIEGQVSLEVVFESSGGVKILRIVHGLGHGLDEAAEEAARQVRFRPATRAGAPVDTTATIYISFELT